MEAVKRKNSWLDAILITLTGEMSLYIGVAVKETNRKAHIMGADNITKEFYGTILDERTVEAHILGADDTIRVYLGVILEERTAEAHAMGSRRYNTLYSTLLYERANETHRIKEESN